VQEFNGPITAVVSFVAKQHLQNNNPLAPMWLANQDDIALSADNTKGNISAKTSRL
jgi:succinylarginine dihydrolase